MASTSNLPPYYSPEDQATEPEMAAMRGVTERGQRATRQRGEASPWVKDGRRIIYSKRKYFEHLERACDRHNREMKAVLRARATGTDPAQ